MDATSIEPSEHPLQCLAGTMSEAARHHPRWEMEKLTGPTVAATPDALLINSLFFSYIFGGPTFACCSVPSLPSRPGARQHIRLDLRVDSSQPTTNEVGIARRAYYSDVLHPMHAPLSLEQRKFFGDVKGVRVRIALEQTRRRVKKLLQHEARPSTYNRYQGLRGLKN